MSSKQRVRIAFPILIGLSLLTVGYGYATGSTATTFEDHLAGDGVVNSEIQVTPPSEGITVVATDSNSWIGDRSDGPRARAELVAFGPNGSVLYYNDSHTRYWDVDPVPSTNATVEYGFADHLQSAACPTYWNVTRYAVDRRTWTEYYDAQRDVGACTLNGFERVNLSTGDVTRVWSIETPGKSGTRYHDIDRLNDTHLVVGDIYLDRVFTVDTATDQIDRVWNASDAYTPRQVGGPYPADWSHINDVEILPDGRIMVSIRNFNRAVFLNRSGVIANWTLGGTDSHEILYEQHNPDFIPVRHGGPAVLVADSENNRVVEYQREDGTWTRSWSYRDARMQWPRDADRLQNGHTLIADSNGNRVFEVNERGGVVWSVTIAFPYEAERLGSGDESTSGQSARRLGLNARSPLLDEHLWIALKGLIPGKYLNGLIYITPVWMGFPELLAGVIGILLGLSWFGMELYWWVRLRLSSRESNTDANDTSVDND